jgi:hypothetical protein
MYTVITSEYSLAVGKIGEFIEGSEIHTECEDGRYALQLLYELIETKIHKPNTGTKFHIRMPDGRLLSFDNAYTEITGEQPVKRDNKANLYPLLKKKKR